MGSSRRLRTLACGVLVAVPVALVGPLQAGHAGTSAEVKVTKVKHVQVAVTKYVKVYH